VRAEPLGGVGGALFMVNREVVGVTGVQEPNGLGKRTELDSSVSIPDGTLGCFRLFSRYRRGTNRNGIGLQGNAGTTTCIPINR
jgi:hypothetical protein